MLLDREEERRELDRLLALVREGLSGVLVVRGEAGIGKSALLEYAVASAGDMQVVSVVGVESEMELGFAGLHQLLVPFLPGLERLPAPQREALGSAFGLITGAAADLFLVGLAALTLLANAAEEQPVLCVVDDAQWLDQASAGSLGFVARRLLADRIVVLFAVREPTERQAAFEGLTELRVGGLPDDHARELLACAASGSLDQRTGERIVAETGGNPLALVELAAELTVGQLAGSSPLPEPLPLGRRLEERFAHRVRTLPQETQTLLVLASAQQGGDPEQLWRAAKSLGIPREAADLPEVDRLIAFEPRVAFRHPLMRSAVYQGASAHQRRQAHEALAASSDPEHDADRRAWHLAAAAVGPDEEVAVELERSADQARNRGGYAATAAFLRRAADLTPDAQRRAVRMLQAAQAELAAGAPALAADMLERATPSLAGPLDRAEARRLEARVRFALGECRTIPASLLDAARGFKALDVKRAREALREAFEVSLIAGREAGETGTGAIADAAREMRCSPGTAESPDDLLLDGVALLDVDYQAGAHLLQGAIRRVVEDDAADGREISKFSNLGFMAALELQDDENAQALSSRALELARERGDLMALLAALGCQAQATVLAGRFSAAEAALAEGRSIASATGNIGAFGSAGILGLRLYVWRGEEARTRTVAAAATAEASERGAGGHVVAVRVQVATLELALGNYAQASDLLRPVYEEDPFYAGTSILPDLIEAATRTDVRAVDAAPLERLAERSLASGTALALGLLARSRALLADDRSAENHHNEAIEHLDRSSSDPELARAHLLYGEWLRRQRRRRDARDQLRTAHDMFDSMGAEAFAERARVELLATGEHVRRRTVATRDELTPQEERIAHLAGRGESNQEIAAQLFISSSTVAYHLRKVFRKLGIHNRAQLYDAIAEQDETAAPT